MELALIFAWLGAAIGAGAIASSKGRSGFGYFLFGFFLPLIGLLVAIGMAPISPANAAPAARRGGDLILCQSCGRPHRADAGACPHCGKLNIATREPATKRCPACAEVILAEARKCKHCGEVISDAPPPPAPPRHVARANWSKVDEIERSLDPRHR